MAAGQWAGLFAPSGVSDEIADKIQADVVAFLNSDEANETFSARGAIVSPMESADFAALLDTLRDRFSVIIEAAAITPE